jgi:hypothetical protein
MLLVTSTLILLNKFEQNLKSSNLCVKLMEYVFIILYLISDIEFLKYYLKKQVLSESSSKYLYNNLL